MMKRSLLVVALGIAHLNLALGGGFISSLDEMLSVRTRDLLAKKWRKAKIEKSVAYEGKPIDVFRGVKSSHSCWVKCKKNKDCSRFTYITGKWKKCELYRRGDKQVRKVKSRGAISGYADWRVTVKRWGKQKPGKKQTKKDKNKNKNKGGKNGREPAYEAPGWSGEEAYEAPGWSGDGAYEAPGWSGDGAYEDPNGLWEDDFAPSAPSGGGYISDYSLMTGKTIFGRRINSILPCVGNIARRYTDCQAQCNRWQNCRAWTWASFDCSWVGDSKDSGVCYLMTDSDERDVFEAPSHGDFVSGMINGGSGGGIEQPYEDWSGGVDLNSPVFGADGSCLLNCGESPSSGAYEAPGY